MPKPDDHEPAVAPMNDARAEELYLRYGARPWRLLPEATREHFRGLVEAGIDGSGRPLASVRS